MENWDQLVKQQQQQQQPKMAAATGDSLPDVYQLQDRLKEDLRHVLNKVNNKLLSKYQQNRYWYDRLIYIIFLFGYFRGIYSHSSPNLLSA